MKMFSVMIFALLALALSSCYISRPCSDDISIGMTMADVLKNCGEPRSKNEIVYETGKTEYWTYDYGWCFCLITFENGMVTSKSKNEYK